MAQLNSLILEGSFNHYTSKKGTLPLCFTVDNTTSRGTQSFNVKIESEKMADLFCKNVKDSKKVRIVGCLNRYNKSISVLAEHIDFTK